MKKYYLTHCFSFVRLGAKNYIKSFQHLTLSKIDPSCAPDSVNNRVHTFFDPYFVLDCDPVPFSYLDHLL